MNYCVPLATTRKLTELFLLRVVLRVDSKISLVPHMDIIESVTNFKFRVDSSRELLLVWISLERKWKFVCTRKKLTMLGSISNVSILQSPNKTNLNAIYVVHVASLFCLVRWFVSNIWCIDRKVLVVSSSNLFAGHFKKLLYCIAV